MHFGTKSYLKNNCYHTAKNILYIRLFKSMFVFKMFLIGPIKKQKSCIFNFERDVIYILKRLYLKVLKLTLPCLKNKHLFQTKVLRFENNSRSGL